MLKIYRTDGGIWKWGNDFCLTLEKYEELDTKWVIIINKSKKDRQHNVQKNKDKVGNNNK